jgi:hypothetical protein
VAAHAASPPAGDAGGALAGEWFTAYTEYLKRAADQSADMIDLYQKVTERIVSGELAPTATRDMLGAFVQTRGTAYTDQLSQLNMRFFSEMVRISTAYAHQLGYAALPAGTRYPGPPPPFDASDPAGWFQELSDYSQQLSASIGAAYQALLDRAAAGEASPGEMQEASANHLRRHVPEYLSELGSLYFDLLNGLTDLRVTSEQEFLRHVLERTNGAQRFELVLAAPAGGTATASLSIANTRDERARIRCDVSEVRRADGVGPAFAPNVTMAPDGLELEPGEESSLVLALTLDEGSYDLDVVYVGTLQISGHGEPRLDVPLRIAATEPVTTTTP